MKSEYSILPWGEKSKCYWAPWAAIGINLLVMMPPNKMNRSMKKERTLLTPENPACQSHDPRSTGAFHSVKTVISPQDSPESLRCLPCFCNKTLPRLNKDHKDHPSSLPCSPLPALVTHPSVPTTLLFFCDGAQLSLQARRCQSRGHYTRGIWTNSRPLVFSESSHIVMPPHHQLPKLCLTFWTLPYRSLLHSVPPSPVLPLNFLLLS